MIRKQTVAATRGNGRDAPNSRPFAKPAKPKGPAGYQSFADARIDNCGGPYRSRYDPPGTSVPMRSGE